MLYLKHKLNIQYLSTLLILTTFICFNCSKPKIEPEPPVVRKGTVSEISKVASGYTKQTKDLLDGTNYSVSITDTTIITERTLNNPPPGPTLRRIYDPDRKQIIRLIKMPNDNFWIDKKFLRGNTDSEIYKIKECIEWEHLDRMFELTGDSSLINLQRLYDSCD